MKGNVKVKSVADFVLKNSSADETEVVLTRSDFGLTRFANNQIHQNVVRESEGVSIRVVLGKRIGVVKTDNLEKSSLKKAVGEAREMAETQRSDPAFKSLPDPAKYPKVRAYFKETADFSPQARAKKVEGVIKEAKSSNLKAFGTLSTGVIEFAVANSRGVWAYFPRTEASFSTTMMSESSSGYGSDLNLRVGKLAMEEETKRAIEKAVEGREPKEIEPGKYEVVLAPTAANTMLIYLAYLGFGARAYHEGRSFLFGKLGKKVMGEEITIEDDGFDSRGIPIPFDLESSLKKKVVLVDKGVAKAVVYDSYLAGKYGAKNTGHGLVAPNTLDALATHLHLKPGKLTEEELVGKVKRGLYISRFWYVNAHHHKSLMITGLTRDGTFLIENGKLACPVVNLRFTQSIPAAFSQVTGVGRNVKVMESWFGANLAPALGVKEFNFTGVSKL